MPNIFNQSNSSKDILERTKNLAPLGVGLEYRTRRDIYPEYSQGSIVVAGTFETIKKTVGTPINSVVKLAIFPPSADTINIASTSTNDTSAGTGARTILIRGLDANWEPLTETITLTGQAPVTTTNNFYRINKLVVLTVGSLGFNEGDIYVSTNTETFSSGIPQNILYYALISKQNLSTFGHFTVKAHHTMQYLKGNVYTNAIESEPILVKESILVDGVEYPFGPSWYSTNISYNFDGAGASVEKEDIRFVGNTATGIREGSITYEVSLVDDLVDRTIT